MILLLKTMDSLEAGLGWSETLDFIQKLALVEPDIKKKKIMEKKINKKNDIKKDISGMIPENRKNKFNHFIQWFGKFKQADLCFLLKRESELMLESYTSESVPGWFEGEF
jgi:hypothetical protein